MSTKEIPVIIPAELEYQVHNGLACLRYHYHLKQPAQLPIAGDLFTGLTLEQAKDTVAFLQTYIEREELKKVLS
ncbi:hypothetical protein [Pectobacterium polonicum]|jgi:hypothetical protein|uniref:hypothetical protein n=1 Tax=Pectobacterium polonicum TaxID=2485124 RepID=UPI002B244691|nr:hypothetical protein [Pectobacterium polonicum]